MRTTRAYGRPGTTVIPDGWGISHAPVAAGAMTAAVSLRLPGATTAWSEAEQRTITTPHTPYATGVPARLQAQRETSLDAAADAAGESIRVTGYLVALSRLVAGTDSVAESHLVDVTACDDPEFVGVTLRVTDLVRGSLRFERDVFAVINDPANPTPAD